MSNIEYYTDPLFELFQLTFKHCRSLSSTDWVCILRFKTQMTFYVCANFDKKTRMLYLFTDWGNRIDENYLFFLANRNFDTTNDLSTDSIYSSRIYDIYSKYEDRFNSYLIDNEFAQKNDE